MIAKTPQPPYYAVIFSTIKAPASADENIAYVLMAGRMEELAKAQPGYLGMETARNETGITVSYWKTLEDIAHWKQNTEHLIAQQMGREHWYLAYTTRICLVERDYSFNKNLGKF